MTASDFCTFMIQNFNMKLSQLLAPARLPRMENWTERITSIAEAAATLDAFLPYIPFFFEVTMAFIEELQRDMANYYISVLAPNLYR